MTAARIDEPTPIPNDPRINIPPYRAHVPTVVKTSPRTRAIIWLRERSRVRMETQRSPWGENTRPPPLATALHQPKPNGSDSKPLSSNGKGGGCRHGRRFGPSSANDQHRLRCVCSDQCLGLQQSRVLENPSDQGR